MFAYVEPGYRIPSQMQVTSMVKSTTRLGERICAMFYKRKHVSWLLLQMPGLLRLLNHLLVMYTVLLMTAAAYRVIY